MFISLKGFILYIFVLKTFSNSKVIVTLRIYNYENENDIKSDGWKCESFHWLNDYCDPMFRICVTSKNKCDILNHNINHWKNKKYVNNVLTRAITLERIERSFSIEVKIDDNDKVDGHDHIAMFNLHLQILQLNHNYAGPMNVTPRGIDVKLRASIVMRCADNYYGENCDKICQPKLFNYNCNPNTGEFTCIMDCGLYGVCNWQKESHEFHCKCNKGWSGDRCQFSNFTSCTNLNCNKKCSDTKTLRYCSCIIGQYVKMCQDPIPVMPTTIMPTTIMPTTIMYTSIKSTSIKSTRIQTKSTLRTSASMMSTTSIKSIKINSTSPRNGRKQSHITYVENGFSPTTAIIICFLLLLLCVCVISLSIVIRSWKKKDKSKVNGFFPSFYSQRPLPPVVYTPRPVNNIQTSIISNNQSNNQQYKPKYTDMCTDQTECQYEVPLIKFDNDCTVDQDPYEEPIINNNDSMTFETNIFEDDDNNSGEYEVPFKIIL